MTGRTATPHPRTPRPRTPWRRPSWRRPFWRRPFWRGLFVAAAGAALLSGCSIVAPVTDPLTGASSMRVDVSVYKGPLSNDMVTQWHNLLGLIDQMKSDIESVDAIIRDSIENKYVTSNHPEGKLDLDSLTCGEAFQGTFSHPKCLAAKRLLSDIATVKKEINDLKLAMNDDDEPDPSHIRMNAFFIHQACRGDDAIKRRPTCTIGIPEREATVGDTAEAIVEYLGHAIRLSSRLSGLSHSWSVSLGAINPNSRTVRASIVGFANFAAQYGDQLEHRADTLLQQMRGLDRKDASLSVKLRNTSLSEFLNLYVWNRAANIALVEDIFLRPHTAFSSEETTDRVRAIERLYQSENWERINEVYASGRGDVSMALIKDDIGNWNLKSFSADPSKLLDAYTNVGAELLKAAASAASGGATSLASLQDLDRIRKAADLGGSLAMPSGDAAPAATDRDVTQVRQLKANVLARLKEVEDDYAAFVAEYTDARRMAETSGKPEDVAEWEDYRDNKAPARIRETQRLIVAILTGYTDTLSLLQKTLATEK